jgi:hypothetical protein
MKNPYTYPHRSHKARIAYLAEHENYHPMNSWNGGFCLSWNVKINRGDYSGKNGGRPSDYPVNLAFDEKWDEYVQANDSLFYKTCEDVFQSSCEDYSTYPGDDAGSYKFSLNGRSGGHLILTHCAIVSEPKDWKMFPMIWASRADYEYWLETRGKEELERFYKAVRCMDYDFAGERVKAEFNYQLASRRSQWEEDLNAEMESGARKIENERPDMHTGN